MIAIMVGVTKNILVGVLAKELGGYFFRRILFLLGGDLRVILGIDPGSRVAGFGILRFHRGKIEHISHGIIALNTKLSFEKRLLSLGEQLSALMIQFNPHIAVIEKIFMGKSADSAFKLGHARGVCVYEAMRANLELIEYAAREMKLGVVGHGGASKDHVQMIMRNQFQLVGSIKEDATDALALAFHHARRLESEEQFSKQGLELPKTRKNTVKNSGLRSGPGVANVSSKTSDSVKSKPRSLR